MSNFRVIEPPSPSEIRPGKEPELASPSPGFAAFIGPRSIETTFAAQPLNRLLDWAIPSEPAWPIWGSKSAREVGTKDRRAVRRRPGARLWVARRICISFCWIKP